MKLKKIVLIVLLLILFSFTADATRLDEEIKDIVDRTNQGFLSSSMSFISMTADTSTKYQLLAIMPNSDLRTDMQFGLLASHTASESIKYVVGRTRPRTGKNELQPFSGHKSFPSGHATGAFSIATAISENYPEYKNYAYLWSSLVAVSRLYEDAHWFSDVVAGAALGHYVTKFVMDYRLTWEF